MDRQTILAFLLIGLILMVWLQYTAPPPPAPQQPKTEDSLVVEKENVKEPDTKSTEKASDTTSVFIQNETERIITIENDLVLVEFSTKGAKPVKYFLKEFKNWYHDESDDFYRNQVQLLNTKLGGSFDLAFVSSEGKSVNTGELIFNTKLNKSKYTVKKGDTLTFSFTLPTANGGAIIKKYSFTGNEYVFACEIEFNNLRNFISNNIYDIVWDSGIRFVEENSADESNYSNASAYYGDEQVILDASSVGETVNKDLNGRVDWIAVRNKYFAAIIQPKNDFPVEGAYLEGTRTTAPDNGVREYFQVRLKVPFKNQDNEKHKYDIYIGPVDYTILKQYGNNLIAIVDFGSFFGLKFIVRPIAEYLLLPLFKFLHSFIPNFGFVIIVFALIIKIIVYPLTKQSFQSMKKMQLLQPKIAEMKEKLKDDPQKMNKEMMKIYSTYGVNPAGGCLPLLLQMPIFIALWGLFQTAVELRQQHFIWWIDDLSRPDVLLNIPPEFQLFGINVISGLAILMGVTTFIQQKMTIKDPKQMAMVYIMPPMLTLLFMTFPSGLNLYYFMFNLFSILQQEYINRYGKDIKLEPVKNPKKSGFMQRMMEAAEKQSKQQQQNRKKR